MSTINLPAGIRAYQPEAPSPTSPTAIGGTAKEIQDNFMKMLMAQIQNQNPLDPAKPAEFTSQLTQLNTVKGIGDLNANVQSFLSQLKASDFLGFSQVVGRNALVPGGEFQFSGRPVPLGGNISGDASDLRAVITDANGQVVDEIALGQARAGAVRLMWDGGMSNGDAAPQGVYRLSLQSVAAQGGRITATPYVSAAVESVGREGEKVVMRLADGRAIASSDVLEWLK